MRDDKSERLDILMTTDKGESRANDHLARTFRAILADLRIDPFYWRTLMKQFVEDPANGVAATSKDRSTAAGNLNKALLSNTMTWKSFIRALRLLSYAVPYIRFEVHYQRGNTVRKRGFDVVNRLNGNGLDITHELEQDED